MSLICEMAQLCIHFTGTEVQRNTTSLPLNLDWVTKLPKFRLTPSKLQFLPEQPFNLGVVEFVFVDRLY